MREVAKIKLEVIFWSFVFNPGAILVGLAMYSLALPERTIFEFLREPRVSYLLLVVGLVMVAATGWRVAHLSKRRKRLSENT